MLELDLTKTKQHQPGTSSPKAMVWKHVTKRLSPDEEFRRAQERYWSRIQQEKISIELQQAESNKKNLAVEQEKMKQQLQTQEKSKHFIQQEMPQVTGKSTSSYNVFIT